MSECTHNCKTCSESCSQKSRAELLEPLEPTSSVKHVVGIVSGKGGVGKSTVSATLASLMSRAGFKVGVLDADITGPSIPKAFGIASGVEGNDHGMIPPESRGGIKIMSVNLLLPDSAQPVVWRGPVIAGTVKQFWSGTVWGDLDYLFVDCPPGTGDVPLTVFQSIPLDGIIIVTSPQELVSMIVEKAVNMARMMNIDVFGIVENMSYVKCPDCGREIKLFGESHIESIANKYGYPLIARMPIDPSLAALVDSGRVEDCECDYLDYAVELLSNIKNKK